MIQGIYCASIQQKLTHRDPRGKRYFSTCLPSASSWIEHRAVQIGRRLYRHRPRWWRCVRSLFQGLYFHLRNPWSRDQIRCRGCGLIRVRLRDWSESCFFPRRLVHARNGWKRGSTAWNRKIPILLRFREWIWCFNGWTALDMRSIPRIYVISWVTLSDAWRTRYLLVELERDVRVFDPEHSMIELTDCQKKHLT